MAEDKLMMLEIVTPQKVVYSGKVQSVSVPGSVSPFQVLYNHAPIVSNLDPGIVKVVDESDKTLFFATNSGFTEVRKNQISVLVENADEAASLDTDSIKLEMKNALDSLNSAQTPEEKDRLKKLCLLADIKLKAVERMKETT
ncbi:MAG: ATP synthase F1 subunit epsilon [Bacteroidetes bacterium]|nr:ATP synthase F1 subunit epsilon [Bacteroidota bacterium]